MPNMNLHAQSRLHFQFGFAFVCSLRLRSMRFFTKKNVNILILFAPKSVISLKWTNKVALRRHLFSFQWHGILCNFSRIQQKKTGFKKRILGISYIRFTSDKSAKMPVRRKNFEYLKRHILPLSAASISFNIAKSEWTLDFIYVTENFEHCPCTQKIKEHCVIRNKRNANRTFVGNVCVKRFMDIDARKLFNGLRKIRKNPEATPNRDLIEYAFRRGYLYGDNEYDFLRNIVNKRKLTEKQKRWVRFINRRIVEKIVVRY